jgi:DNA-binding response OmpR family regulator
MKAEVLVFSRDQLLLETRQLILGAFFRVRGAVKIEDAEALLVMHEFDLIILCSSLSEEDCQRVFDLVESRKPRPQILILINPGSERNLPDYVEMIDSGPYQLLKRSAEVLGMELNAAD